MLKGLLKNEVNQEDYTNPNNIKIIYKSLYIEFYEIKTFGFTFNYKNIKIIILNDLYGVNDLRKALIHEIAHVELSHSSSDKPHSLCEKEANEFVENLLKI